MKKLLLLIICAMITHLGYGQIASYDFDDNVTDATLTYYDDHEGSAGDGATTTGCNNNATSYFGTVSLNGVGAPGDDVGTAVSLTGGDGGTFFGTQDMDGTGCPGTSSLELAGFDITGESSVVLCFEIAEDDAADGNNDWDTGEAIKIQAQVDNGSYIDLLSIHGTGTNTDPSIDAGCDGAGDATNFITSTFTTYCVNIPLTGSTLDIIIDFTGLATTDEDIAFDNFQIYNTDLTTAVTNSGAAAGFSECSLCGSAPSTSSGTGDISFSTIANPSNSATVDENIIDDPFLLNPTIGQTYGTVTTTATTGGGTITGLVDNSSTSIGTVNFQLYEVNQSCADDAVVGDILTSDGSTGTTLQDASPTPTVLNNTNIFTENIGSGTTSGRNQVCIDLTSATSPVMEASFWIGDVETSESVPGYIFMYDTNGDLLANEAIPTTTSLANQTNYSDGVCDSGTGGSTAQNIGGDCGNDETIFVALTADVAIGTICIQVGDYPDDVINSGASEHLSFGGFATDNILNIVLAPVDLLHFTATRESDVSLLTWATASEENNSHFEVQWSTNGESFRTIGEVDGFGDSAERIDYSFTHENPSNGTNYYRLKQIDFDGAFEYSKISTVVFADEKEISVRPTLATSSVELVTSQAFEKDAQVEIFNLAGQKVLETLLTEGMLTKEIEVSHLAKGHYFVRVNDDADIFTTRFIKQ